MILAVNDPDAPIINEQVTSETFSLSMDEGSGLSASAQTQDIMSETEVSVRVYESGQLVAEDQSPGMALVQ
jgi:hypothetical protein